MEETNFISKDGKTRVFISQDKYADNPRHMTDEPFHCEDWSRDYSIMIKDDREHKSNNARDLIEYFLRNYADNKAIIDILVENGKHMEDEHCKMNNALVYDKSERHWVLKEFVKYSGDNEYTWYDVEYFDERKYDIYLYTLLSEVSDETIDALVEKGLLSDQIKAASYSFGYNGEVMFHDGFDTSSLGIAWLEKDEFLKYSGCDEERWKNNTLREIEFLLGELEAWTNNEVYIVSVEHAVRVKNTREYPDGEHETEVKEYIKWEHDDCCGGFYGEYDKMLPFMFEQFGLKQEDFEEVKE